jgi:flagellar motor switch/type III secretory pathway protein FliN
MRIDPHQGSVPPRKSEARLVRVEQSHPTDGGAEGRISTKIEPFVFAEFAPAKQVLRIEIGSVRLRRTELEKLEPGSTIVFENAVADDVTLRCGPDVVARAKVVVIDGRIALRIT